MIGFAVLFGLLAVFLAQTWLNNQEAARMKSLEAQRKAPAPEHTIVVAARPLRFGDALDRVGAARNAVAGRRAAGRRVRQDRRSHRDQARRADADGAQRSGAGLEDHRPGQRATLSAVLDPGMKAVTIRVNDVEGVAGFVLPGDHVDVMLTRQGEKNTAVNDVVIENAQVLAIDQLADEKTDKPSVVKAVTLEVKATDGEKLALAVDGRHAVAAAAQGRRRRRRGFARCVTPPISASRRPRQFGFRDRRGDRGRAKNERAEYSVPVEHDNAHSAALSRPSAGAGERLMRSDEAERSEICVWGHK